MNKKITSKIGLWCLIVFGCIALISCRPQRTTSSGTNKKGDKSSGSFWKVRGTVELEENPSYTGLFQKALKKRRPIFISFYTDWCTTCPFMNGQMIEKQPIVGLLEEDFVGYLVDAETGDGYKLVNEYKIAAYPTILFLNSEGEEISRYIGLPDEHKVTQMAKSALIAEDKFQKAKEQQRKK